MTELTFLGTGTSQGIPMIGCKCSVCCSKDKKDKRLRSSVLIEHDRTAIIIDTGPDFRYQILREGISRADAVLFTHSHKDHTAGLDDIRGFNYVMGKGINIYAEEHCMNVIMKDFDYAFAEHKYPGVPEITPNIINTQPFRINNIEVIPIRGKHHLMPVLGFRIGNLCYITDMNSIDDDELSKMKGVNVFIINALRHSHHISHFTLNEALSIIKKVGAKESYITHISHQMGEHEKVSKTLPEGVFLSYDRLKVYSK